MEWTLPGSTYKSLFFSLLAVFAQSSEIKNMGTHQHLAKTAIQSNMKTKGRKENS
jgi:hypothetical protein